MRNTQFKGGGMTEHNCQNFPASLQLVCRMMPVDLCTKHSAFRPTLIPRYRWVQLARSCFKHVLKADQPTTCWMMGTDMSERSRGGTDISCQVTMYASAWLNGKNESLRGVHDHGPALHRSFSILSHTNAMTSTGAGQSVQRQTTCHRRKDFIKTGPWPHPIESWDKQCVIDTAIPFICRVHICLKNRPQVRYGADGIPFAHRRFIGVAHFKREGNGEQLLDQS